MKPIPSTAEILAFKMIGRSIDKRWVDWAYDMLCEGFDTENLVMLAGETEPFNQFEMQRLTDQVFEELGLKWDDREAVLKNYVSYLIDPVLAGKKKADVVLSVLYGLYQELGYESSLNDFSLLYWAKDDLRYSDDQWYWPGATRGNIDEIIMNYFTKWREEYEGE
ncbi:MAG TPA: hypothetical protein VHA56_19585 [Mucilaginibacter sp.]|nr:hypothetical protein [Mucilaginibacter sp.]